MRLNDMGKIIYNQWFDIPRRFKQVELDKFIVMPNHIHGIIKIVPLGAPLAGVRKPWESNYQ
ncbi:MAG: hypothetical protein L3J71_15020 [Victivallaceae bacterium]|nr:hypothetical protein [Victivallaceae bacterium]